MLFCCRRFNLYFGLGLALLFILGAGCQTETQKRHEQLTTLRIYLEVGGYDTNRVQTVSVFRQRPFQLRIENEPFIHEGDLSEAKVVQVVGGFSIQLQFDRQGTRLLEQYSALNRGKHLAIFSQFADAPGGPINSGRWLAAPVIREHIRDGLLTFAPDATREEAEQIVVGLNNVARKLHNNPK